MLIKNIIPVYIRYFNCTVCFLIPVREIFLSSDHRYKLSGQFQQFNQPFLSKKKKKLKAFQQTRCVGAHEFAYKIAAPKFETQIASIDKLHWTGMVFERS